MKIMIVLLLLFLLFPCSLYMNHKVFDSVNFADGKFRNAVLGDMHYEWSKMFKLIFGKQWGRWPSWIDNTKKPALKRECDDDHLVLTFINHATFLIEVGDKKIITDPIFSTFAGPFGLFGVKRRRNPGIILDDLPKVDVILISHNHYDHLDLPSLHKIQKKNHAIVIVPLGDKEWLTQEGIKNVQELDWWESFTIDDQLTVNFVPSQHFSGRGLLDKDTSLWGGYVIVNPHVQIYHAGDTGYSDHFKEIGERFNIDVALLPIGAYKPAKFLQYVHMNPDEAIRAHHDLKSKVAVSMHFETFPLSALNYDEAKNDLQAILAKENVISNQFKILEVGESYYYNLN